MKSIAGLLSLIQTSIYTMVVSLSAQFPCNPQIDLHSQNHRGIPQCFPAFKIGDSRPYNQILDAAGTTPQTSTFTDLKTTITMPPSTATILTTLTRRPAGTIAHLTISRPTKLNALNTPLLSQLPTTLQSLTSQTPDLLCVILTGAGNKSFIGGADIAEMAALDSPASARAFISRVSEACRSLRECPVPVIGRVNGYALGAGLEVAASCDFRVASRRAVFGMPEVSLI